MLAVMKDARVRAGDGHAAWSESFNELFAQAAGVFGNAAVRRHGRAYLLGLLSHTERKNCWTIAEYAGDVTPDGMQHLLTSRRGTGRGPRRRAPVCGAAPGRRGRGAGGGSMPILELCRGSCSVTRTLLAWASDRDGRARWVGIVP